jgi:hypothetical protein
MMWSRRQFLQVSAAGLALANLRCKGGGRSAAPLPTAGPVAKPRSGPRYIVILDPDGGPDAILTTNPRTRDQVNAEVDLPYGPEGVVEVGGIKLGPHFAPLAPFAKRMAIVNGVALDTANHYTGWAQVTRLRTRPLPGAPGVLDICGDHRDDQPLSCITFGSMSPVQFSPNYADGQGVFQIHKLGRDALTTLSNNLFDEADSVAAAGADLRFARTAANYREIGQLAQRLVDLPELEFASWPEVESNTLPADLQRLVWALEHDLVRCAFVKIRPFSGWDSHSYNAITQRNCSRVFCNAFLRFMHELDTRRNEYGTLASNTLVVVGSEIGRFPRLNDNLGKDHFPEAPMFFVGPGVNTGDGAGAMFGVSDDRMAALPIELASGRKATRGGHRIRLDDIGATILAAAHIPREPYGFHHGRVLPFLLADA